MKVPVAVGVPLMVITLPAHEALTPAGNPDAAPMPVAPVVLCVMFVSTVFTHKVGEADAAATVLFALTVMVPVALILTQLAPVTGMV